MIASLFSGFIATRLGKLLPSWAWELVFIALLIGGGMLIHHVQVVHHDNGVRAAQKAVDDAADQKIAQKAIELKQQVDTLTANITAALRKRTDEQNIRIAGDADSLSVRGPGKAACPSSPRLPSAPSGPVAAPAKPDASGPPLPSTDGADVSWNWLVGRGEEHDELLNENKSWRDWYAQLVKAWPKH